jgi:hypothetical protein
MRGSFANGKEVIAEASLLTYITLLGPYTSIREHTSSLAPTFELFLVKLVVEQ